MPQLAAFIDHWKTTRGLEMMPRLEGWLSDLPTVFLDATFWSHLDEQDAMTIYAGPNLARLFRQNNVGKSMYEGFGEERKSEALKSLPTLIAKPCGYYFENEHVRVDGHSVLVRGVMMPIETTDMRARHLIGHVAVAGQPDDITLKSAVPRATYVRWLDIGAGLPDRIAS